MQIATSRRERMPAQKFAFPKERKEPLNDASHVRNAIARFDQVQGVSDSEREAAWRRIRTAARKFGVEVEAKGWRSLMKPGKASKTSGKTTGKTSGRATGRTTRNKPARRAS
jgi:hypothetical protein